MRKTITSCAVATVGGLLYLADRADGQDMGGYFSESNAPQRETPPADDGSSTGSSDSERKPAENLEQAVIPESESRAVSGSLSPYISYSDELFSAGAELDLRVPNEGLAFIMHANAGYATLNYPDNPDTFYQMDSVFCDSAAGISFGAASDWYLDVFTGYRMMHLHDKATDTELETVHDMLAGVRLGYDDNFALSGSYAGFLEQGLEYESMSAGLFLRTDHNLKIDAEEILSFFIGGHGYWTRTNATEENYWRAFAGFEVEVSDDIYFGVSGTWTYSDIVDRLTETTLDRYGRFRPETGEDGRQFCVGGFDVHLAFPLVRDAFFYASGGWDYMNEGQGHMCAGIQILFGGGRDMHLPDRQYMPVFIKPPEILGGGGGGSGVNP